MGLLDGIISGGLTGGVSTALGLLPSAFKFFSGLSQKSQANAINPANPGYQLNNEIIDNARLLGDRYNNYTLPGSGQIQNNINNTYQNAFSQGSQGATSGGDVSDLAVKLAYGKNIAENNLAQETAQGKAAALGAYTDANADAGKEYQAKNAYDRDNYNKALLQKAALTQAGNTNEYNALDSGASVLSNYLNPKHSLSDNTNNANPTASGSIFDSGGNDFGMPTTGRYDDWLKFSTRNGSQSAFQ